MAEGKGKLAHFLLEIHRFGPIQSFEGQSFLVDLQIFYFVALAYRLRGFLCGF